MGVCHMRGAAKPPPGQLGLKKFKFSATNVNLLIKYINQVNLIKALPALTQIIDYFLRCFCRILINFRALRGFVKS